MLIDNIKQFSINTVLALKEYVVSSGGVLAIITGFMYGMPSLLLAISFLILSLIIDFVTGVIASYCEWKDLGSPKLEKSLVFKTKRARESVNKVGSYGTAILLAYILAVVTMKNPEVTILGMPPKTIPEITVIVLIAIECFSVIENFKRMGVDFIGKIKNIAKQGWDLFRNVKKGEF